jgi:gas vesicle protein
MSDNSGGGEFFAGLLIGGLVGAAAALLMAPQSGEETRTQIRDASFELKERANETIAEAREKADAITADARRRAEEIVAEGRKRSEEMVSEARKRAEEIQASLPSSMKGSPKASCEQRWPTLRKMVKTRSESHKRVLSWSVSRCRNHQPKRAKRPHSKSGVRKAPDGPAMRPETPLAVENSVGKPAAIQGA